MGELVIKTHDFEVAKSRLKAFSQNKTAEMKLERVKEDGGFLGLGSHKVTGYELNERLSVIQRHLIELNKTDNQTIKEFGQVYSALEALDKDYIQAILISLKASEKTSQGIALAQENIRQIVEDQKRTLGVLKIFKQKLDAYAHLEDIDDLWKRAEIHGDNISSLYQQCEKIVGLIKDIQSNIDELNEWQKSISDNVRSNQSEVDKLWEANKVHTEQINSVQEEMEKMQETIQVKQKTLEAALAENNTRIEGIDKKVKSAYLVAGGAIGLALVELGMLLLKGI